MTPSNVVIRFDGVVKLVDFSVAAHVLAGADEESNQIVGNLPYLPPEVLTRSEVSPLSDLWSAGILLYELVTGEVPFQGASAEETASAILRREVEVPKAIPRQLRSVIERCLEKDPSRRYRSATELHAALGLSVERLAGGRFKRVQPWQVTAALGAWTRERFKHQVKLEREFLERSQSGSLLEALVTASPDEVGRFLRERRQGAARMTEVGFGPPREA